MKDHSFLISILVVMIVPSLLISQVSVSKDVLRVEKIEDSSPQTPTEHDRENCTVRVKTKDGTVTMELDAYVAGVLMGEMPADFEVEALKAQAVAIRTYTLQQLSGSKHPDADVCTDATCCQAFEDLAMEDLQRANADKIYRAVEETKGDVITYNNGLIDATYFSCSGGWTEDAAAVWGADIPYLQSRESPGEESATYYVGSVKMSTEEFLGKLNLSGSVPLNIGPITYTDGKGVEEIDICGTCFTGKQVRQLLGLSSTAFLIQAIDNSVIITTKGNGHRVGLSQYGAEAMAVAGSTYRQILEYYYFGATVENWSEDQIQGVFDKARNL